MNQLTDEQTGWLAGFLEGEGCFVTTRSHPRKDGSRLRSPRIRISQVDKTMIERLVEYTGVGRVGGPWRDKRGTRLSQNDIWAWDVSNPLAVDCIVCSVFHLLSDRRQQQVLKMYSDWRASCRTLAT